MFFFVTSELLVGCYGRNFVFGIFFCQKTFQNSNFGNFCHNNLFAYFNLFKIPAKEARTLIISLLFYFGVFSVILVKLWISSIILVF